MKLVDYSKLKPTRDFLQDVAKVIGKAQQVFLPEDPHELQRGILVTENGLASQEFNSTHVLLDMKKGEVKTESTVWSLREYSAQDLLGELRGRISSKIAEPEFSTSTVQFDPEVAGQLTDILAWSKQLLQEMKSTITAGETTPVLLFPHHFDVSFAWFASKEQQYTFGFSTGDETIPEPYFYVTAYPEPSDFTNKTLPEPAYWQKQDFSGAVLKYNDAVTQSNPENLVKTYFRALL